MRLVLSLLLAASSASAQPADSSAARRPAWLTLSGQIHYQVRDSYDAGWDYLGASIQYHRTLGQGPAVVQVGASTATGIFGGNALSEVHVALGASASVGPLFVTATAGPSLGSTFSPSRTGDVAIVGGYAAVQAEIVVVPFFGLGAEAFVHANAVRPLAGFGVVYAFGRLPGALIPNPPPTPRRPGP